MAKDEQYHIVVAEPFDAEALERLSRIGTVNCLADSSPQALLTAVPQADALLVRSRTHVTARIIDAAERLKVIGRAGLNIDHIDLRAAQRRNISVVYAPDAAVGSIAEYNLALMLSLNRRLMQLNRQIREGQFEALREPAGRDLRNQTLCLLGIDAVARRFAAMARAALECRVLYHDPDGRSDPSIPGDGVELDALLSEADVLSLHLQLTSATRHMLNAERIGRMKPSAIVLNTSRGGVIDTEALAEALKTRRLGGAGLDVFEAEPLPANHPLRTAPNCILTPHVAAATLDAQVGRFDVTEDVIRVLHGETPRYPATTA